MEFDLSIMTPAEKAAARAEQKRAKKDQQALEYLLSDEKGRWFLMRLFERCHMMGSTWPDEDHTNRMIIWEGERRVALGIQSSIVDDLHAVELKTQAEREYYEFMISEQKLIDAAENERKE